MSKREILSALQDHEFDVCFYSLTGGSRTGERHHLIRLMLAGALHEEGPLVGVEQGTQTY